MKLVYVSVSAFFVLASTCLVSPALARPNVVVFFIDDMGYGDPGCFGNPVVKTPNIDRLAAEGIKFTNFYVNSPICSASRVALTTGRYQQRYRIHSYFADRQRNQERKMPNWLDSDAPTLAKTLKQNGYHTAHFGKWHMGGGRDVHDAPLPQSYGFDQSLVSFEGLGDRILWNAKDRSWQHGRGEIRLVEKHKTTETYVDRAVEFIHQHKDDSFYLRVFPNDVHDAHRPSESQLAKWKDKADNEFQAKFFAVLDEMDRQLGRVLDTIDELGLAENTLVIFTSDNGPTDWPHYYKKEIQPPGFTGPLFGRKWSLYEGGIRMPFLARWPGNIPAGTVDNETIMAAMDLFPTIARLTASELPSTASLDGLDRSRALLGKPIKRETPIFWEYGVHGSISPGKAEHRSPQLAMRDGDWKLLCNSDGSDLALFNLTEDIGERSNLAKENPDVARGMKQRVLEWWTAMAMRYAATD